MLSPCVAVGYTTGGVTPAETTAWQRLAGQYGRATYVHGRYSSQKPPETGMLGFEEILANAAVFYPYNFGVSICGADYLKLDNYGPNMGRGYKDIIETATLKPLTKKRYDHLMDTNPGTSIMFYGSTDADMDAGLVYPTSVIGSDSFPMTVTKTGALARDWDLAVFDPKTVQDNSTMQQGGLPTTGMPYVVANGTIVVDDSKVLKGVTPGKPVRLPVVA